MKANTQKVHPWNAPHAQPSVFDGLAKDPRPGPVPFDMVGAQIPIIGQIARGRQKFGDKGDFGHVCRTLSRTR